MNASFYVAKASSENSQMIDYSWKTSAYSISPSTRSVPLCFYPFISSPLKGCKKIWYSREPGQHRSERVALAILITQLKGIEKERKRLLGHRILGHILCLTAQDQCLSARLGTDMCTQMSGYELGSRLGRSRNLLNVFGLWKEKRYRKGERGRDEGRWDTMGRVAIVQRRPKIRGG